MPDSPTPSAERIPSALLLTTWLSVGIQSFGGGSVTLALIRRTVVERYGWVSEADFLRDWALSQLAPGINLLALTTLIGRRLAGARGIALCLLGLLLPSALLTILLTAGYAQIREWSVVRAALRGIVPATVGLGLLTAGQLAWTALKQARSADTLPWSALVLIGSAALVYFLRAPATPVLLGAAALCGLVYARRRPA